MKKLLIAALLLAVTASVALAADKPVFLTDASGDGKGAPDVLGLAVHQQGKRVVFEFALADRTERLKKGEYLVFFVDADNNPKTGGNGAGADYTIDMNQSTKELLRVSKYNPKSKLIDFDKSFNASFGKLWGTLTGPAQTWRFYFTPSMFGIKPGQTFGFYGRAESAGSGNDYTFDRVPNGSARSHFTVR